MEGLFFVMWMEHCGAFFNKIFFCVCARAAVAVLRVSVLQ